MANVVQGRHEELWRTKEKQGSSAFCTDVRKRLGTYLLSFLSHFGGDRSGGDAGRLGEGWTWTSSCFRPQRKLTLNDVPLPRYDFYTSPSRHLHPGPLLVTVTQHGGIRNRVPRSTGGGTCSFRLPPSLPCFPLELNRNSLAEASDPVFTSPKQDLEEEDKLEAIKGILETEGAEVSSILASFP